MADGQSHLRSSMDGSTSSSISEQRASTGPQSSNASLYSPMSESSGSDIPTYNTHRRVEPEYENVTRGPSHIQHPRIIAIQEVTPEHPASYQSTGNQVLGHEVSMGTPVSLPSIQHSLTGENPVLVASYQQQHQQHQSQQQQNTSASLGSNTAEHGIPNGQAASQSGNRHRADSGQAVRRSAEVSEFRSVPLVQSDSILGFSQSEIEAYKGIRKEMDKLERHKERRRRKRVNNELTEGINSLRLPDEPPMDPLPVDSLHPIHLQPRHQAVQSSDTNQPLPTKQAEPSVRPKPTNTIFTIGSNAFAGGNPIVTPNSGATLPAKSASRPSNQQPGTQRPTAYQQASATGRVNLPQGSATMSPPPAGPGRGGGDSPSGGRSPGSDGNPGQQNSAVKQPDIQVELRKLQLLVNSNKMDDALKKFRDAVSNQNQPRSERAALPALGSKFAKVLLKDDKYFESIQVLKASLEIIDRIGVQGPAEFNVRWELHDDLAVCHSRLGQEALEAKHYQIAIDLLSTVSAPPERYPHMMNNLGNCYKNLKRYDDAERLLVQAKEIMKMIHQPEQTKQYPEEYQKVLTSLADLYKAMDKRREAISEYEGLVKGIESGAVSISQAMRVLNAKRSLAELYLLVGDVAKAQAIEPEADSIQAMISATGEEVKGASTDGKEDSRSKLARALSHSENVKRAQAAQKAGDNRTAVDFYERALQDAEAAGDALNEMSDKRKALSLIHNNVGNAYQALGRYNDAKEHLNAALKLRKSMYGACGINDDLASTYFNLGNLYNRMEKRTEAINHHNEAIRIYTALGDADGPTFPTWLARSYKSLGLAYQNRKGGGDPLQSVKAYENAKRIMEEKNIGSVEELQAVTNNLGNAYEDIGEYRKAQDVLKRSLELVEMMLADKGDDMEVLNDKAACFNNLGIAYKSEGDLEQAKRYLEECCDLRLKLSAVSNKAVSDYPGSLFNLANCYKDQANHLEALKQFEKAEQAYRRIGRTDQCQQCKIAMSICYENLGDAERAASILDD